MGILKFCCYVCEKGKWEERRLKNVYVRFFFLRRKHTYGIDLIGKTSFLNIRTVCLQGTKYTNHPSKKGKTILILDDIINDLFWDLFWENSNLVGLLVTQAFSIVFSTWCEVLRIIPNHFPLFLLWRLYRD